MTARVITNGPETLQDETRSCIQRHRIKGQREADCDPSERGVAFRNNRAAAWVSHLQTVSLPSSLPPGRLDAHRPYRGASPARASSSDNGIMPACLRAMPLLLARVFWYMIIANCVVIFFSLSLSHVQDFIDVCLSILRKVNALGLSWIIHYWNNEDYQFRHHLKF